jgi:hypothetical protein
MAGVDDHGHALAAWAAVIIIIVAFILGGVAIVISNWSLFWIAVGLVVVGGIVAKVGGMVRGGVPPR